MIAPLAQLLAWFLQLAPGQEAGCSRPQWCHPISPDPPLSVTANLSYSWPTSLCQEVEQDGEHREKNTCGMDVLSCVPQAAADIANFLGVLDSEVPQSLHTILDLNI